MNIDRILSFSKQLIKKCTDSSDISIDATVGNGNDTLFLASLSNKVYGFDIQETAINNTKTLLEAHNIHNVQLFQIGHENIIETIPKEEHGKIASAMFNLGYLPKGDKSITTLPHTTLEAIRQILQILKVNGIIVLVVYHGHEEGKVEKDALLNYVNTLNQKELQVLQYKFLNQKNDAPFIIAIEKIK